MIVSKDNQIIIKDRLDGTQRRKLANLMNMMYSPSELADEAFCIRCKKPVKMKNQIRKESKGIIYYLTLEVS